MLIVSFPDVPDILVSVDIEGRLYYLRILYNATEQYWTLSLRDKDNQALIEGIKMVPNYPLFWNYHAPGIPSGEFMALSQKDIVGRNDFKTGAAKLIYMTQEEYYGTI